MTRWTAQQALALAPDASSEAAARKLVSAPGWSGEGATAQSVWGLCRGSGKNPYQTVVDLAGPAYNCSCPSRKFPCKHALALLIRWADGTVPNAPEVAPFAASWLASRCERAEGVSERQKARAASGGDVADPAAAAKRLEQRVARIEDGLEELDRWLADQVRGGLAGMRTGGYKHLDQMAARLVDSQAPGVARWVRGLAGVLASGPDWPRTVLEELALMRLLVLGHRQVEQLDRIDPALAATIRGHVGYPVAKQEVLASPPVTDVWDVWAMRDAELDNLRSRTVWVHGRRTGRTAVVLSFAGAGGALDASLVPGTAFHGPMHFYPGSGQHRAIPGEAREDRSPLWPEVATTDAALDLVAAAVALDPWIRSVPVVLDAAPALRDPAGSNRVQPQTPSWELVTREGARLPVHPSAPDPWHLLAVSGGKPIPVLVEWTPAGWRPVTCWHGDAVHRAVAS